MQSEQSAPTQSDVARGTEHPGNQPQQLSEKVMGWLDSPPAQKTEMPKSGQKLSMIGNPLAPNSQTAPPPEKSWSDYAWSLITPSPAHAAEGPPPGTGVQGPTQGPVSGPAQPEPVALVTGVAQTTQEPRPEPGPVSGPAQPEPVAQVTGVAQTTQEPKPEPGPGPVSGPAQPEPVAQVTGVSVV